MILYSDALRATISARLERFSAIHRADAGEFKRAAVAIVIVPLDQRVGPDGVVEAAFLLTRRARKLRAHAGQLALPGGRVDVGETVDQTALRELREELDIELAPAAILGRLDDYPTRSGYLISPIVVWCPPGLSATVNASEVESLFRIPLAELRHPDALEFSRSEESARPLVRVFLPTLGDHVNAPTAAMLYQFAEVALEGRPTRVDHFDQPVWAWR